MTGENVAMPYANTAARQRTRRPAVENGALGMLVFVVAEAMMFAGLVSAFMIAKAGNVGNWPPPGQPRLPLEETAINTLALLVSGGLVLIAARAFRAKQARTAPLLLIAILLGAFFVFFQGLEWVALIRQGLTLTSSQQGSFFYLIVGMHGLHAVAAITFLSVSWMRLSRGELGRSAFSGACVLWYFVVGIWPLLYLTLYR